MFYKARDKRRRILMGITSIRVLTYNPWYLRGGVKMRSLIAKNFAVALGYLLCLWTLPGCGGGLVLKGTVFSGENTPVNDATITAKNVGGETTYTVDTDKNGRYEIKGIKPGNYDLMAERGGYTKDEKSEELIVEHSEINFILNPLVTITGSIKAPDGTLMADTELLISSANGTSINVRTDVNGKFEVKDITPGEYTIRVYAGETSQSFGLTFGENKKSADIVLEEVTESSPIAPELREDVPGRGDSVPMD